MYPVTATRQTRISLFPMTAGASIKLLVVCLVIAAVPVALYVRVDSKESKTAVTVQAAGRGNSYLNLHDGREMQVKYRGDQVSSEALQSGAARARALASADLDDNGTPDVLAGYAYNGNGIVTVQRGSTEAFAPTDDSVFVRVQGGYNPDSLAPTAETYQVPEPADFLVAGDFNHDGVKDILLAARGGGAYLMSGDGYGGLKAAEQIALPGPVTAMAAAEFGMADGQTDAAVGVLGPEGPALLVFPSAEGGLSTTESFPLSAEATAIQFGMLDQDPFLDVVVAAGNEIEIIHGWGRKNFANTQSRVERINVPNSLRGLALGNFIWDRENRIEIAAQAADGTVSILERGTLDTRAFSEEEVAVRVRMRGKVTKQTTQEIEAAPSWQADKAEPWNAAREFAGTGVATGADPSQGLLVSSHISWQQTDQLLVLDAGQNKLKIIQQTDAIKNGVQTAALSGTADISATSLDVTSAPVAVAALPRKINGERDLVLLGSERAAATMIPLAPTATFTVTKTTDTNDGFCNADCSLREAVVAANGVPGSTVSVPAGTYQLTINGTAEAGFCQSPGTGDLDISANNTTITGAGSATTIIQQTQPNDRVICIDQALAGNFTFNMSGVTITGGRETFAVGGGGMVSGAANDNTTVTNCTFSNNQSSGGSGPGGGGLNNLGGSLTVTGCTVGGTSAPGASQLIVAQANSCSVSGGGLSHSPGDPNGGASNGVLTVTGSTFQNNTAASGAAGGGGADVFTHNLGTGSHSFATSTFLSNKATVGNGGGIIIESLPCTVATTAFTTNAAQGGASLGGGIYVSGGALVLNGTSPTITFSGNTATIAGSSISTAASVNVSGTNTTIGGDIHIPTNGIWTNNAGSALSPTNVVIAGGTFNMNNSTMTVTGNFLFGPGPAVGGTFNGNTGTVNIAGNFTSTAGGAGPATTFNAGTSTFNFNGSGAQSISGSLSPTFSTLIVNKGSNSALTLGVSTPISSTLTVTAGILDLSTFTANRTVLGGTLTVSNGATLKIGGSGSIPSNYSTYALGTTSTVEYNGTGTQTIAAVNYGHLTSSSTGARTLVNGSTTGIAGVFTPGTNTYTITGSTVDFNGSVAQTIPAFNFNNLTISNTHGANAVTLVNGGTIGIAGTFTPGTSTFTITGNTVNFNGTGAQTVPVFNFNNLSISGARTVNSVTLVNGGTIGIAGTFAPTATFTSGNYIITNNTIDFNGAGAQTVAAFNYNNLTISGNRAVAITLGNGNVGVAGTFNPSVTGNTWTANAANTVVFNGSALQTIPAFAFFNGLTLSNAAGANLGGNVTVLNGLTLNAGALGVAANTLTLNGAASFGAGTLTSSPTGTVIYNQQSNGQATVLAANYGNLTFSNFSKTLAGIGTIGIAGTFTPGTGTGHTITGSTINFNAAGPQTIPGFTYNNLTSSGGVVARTLDPVNTIKIFSVFTPGTNVYTITGSTVEYNGAAAQTLPATFMTYNNLTLNNPTTVAGFAGLTVQGLLRVQAGTFTSSSSYNNVQIDPGATMVATAASTINVSGNWTNNGTFTPGTGTVIFSGNNNTQTLAGNTTFNNLTINHTGTGGVTASGSTLAVTGLLEVQGGTFTSSSTFNNVQIDSGTTLASDGSTMNVSGNWTNNGGTFTPSTGTVNFNGAGAQAINGTAASQTFGNFAVNKSAGALSAGGSTTSITTNNLTMTLGTFTAPATLDINGNTLLTAGTLTAGTSITAAGSWTNNGATFTAGAGTVTFDGGAGQTIGGTTATTFNNLTNSDAGGISMANDNTVNGILALTSSDITVAATKTLTQPNTGSSSGTFDVNGRVQRTGFGAGALSFGNPLNTIQVTGGVAPANIVVDLTRSVPTGPQGFPTAVQRTYTITPSAGGFTGTLRLHYLDSELNGNTEGPDFIFRRFNGTGWAPVLPTSSDFGANWLEAAGVTQFSAWTFNSTFAPTASNGVVTGRIVDNNGNPVEGAVVRLSGTQNRKFITDANGVYRFDNVETSGFYTVTPSRANYSFSPAARSFSQLGQATEAAFGATLASSGFVNPLDTPEYFVRQHYLDFLGREPDEAGFNFWSDQIIECGTDNQCSERHRVNVSAAYFFSIEFQQTGGLVDGLYRASYGVRPQFATFMPDTRAVGLGVVVGRDGWQAKLEANKQAFVEAFVSRAAFHAAYDGLSSSDYVDALIAHTGVSFSSGEREAWVSSLTTGGTSRADVLRSIAENQRFVAAKFNDAFVMMEYFGYLRRDADADGFAFWLNKLNQFGGNFEQAEMVKAFIVSGEFRDRFPR